MLVKGPRQSGKTTLVRMFEGTERGYITPDDESVLSAATEDPVGSLRGLDTVIIDLLRLTTHYAGQSSTLLILVAMPGSMPRPFIATWVFWSSCS